jgi:hypothetical protein
MEAYYAVAANKLKLWPTDAMQDLVEHVVPRMASVPYAAVNWLNTGTNTPNNLRVWIEAYIIDHADAKKSDWQQLYDFAMVATQ